MRITNFDKSSSGINIELSCFYDLDRSRDDFKDNFIQACLEKYYVFTDWGNIDPDLELMDLFVIPSGKKLISEFCRQYGITLFTGVRDFLNQYDLKPSDCAYSEILYMLKNELGSNDEVFDFLDQHCDRAFDEIKTIGYSQGDYASVIVKNDYWTIGGSDRSDKTIEGLSEYINHLFWDAPIYCRLTIDGIEYDATDYLENQYEYDKAEMIELFKQNIADRFNPDQWQIITDFLADNLPDSPDYY